MTAAFPLRTDDKQMQIGSNKSEYMYEDCNDMTKRRAAVEEPEHTAASPFGALKVDIVDLWFDRIHRLESATNEFVPDNIILPHHPLSKTNMPQ